MSSEISKSKFKAKALEIFRKIELTGEAIIITDHGKPVLEIIPYKNHDPLNKLKGSVISYDDPFEPVGESDWENL